MTRDLHVVPVYDLREHDDNRDCWCQPVIEQEPDVTLAVVIHRSMDGRELIEEHGVN